MLKHMLCAAVAAGFVVAALPGQAASVAPGTPCKEAAKILYPDDHKARHHFKKSCKQNFKHSEKS